MNDSNEHLKEDDFESQWYRKLKFLLTMFHIASIKYWMSFDILSLNEFMKLCKIWNVHTMNIDQKKVDKKYKIYCLIDKNYLFVFQLTFKKRNVEKLITNVKLNIKDSELNSTQLVILQLINILSTSNVIVMNNFFCNIKFDKKFKRIKHDMMTISKTKSEFSIELLKLRSVSSKMHNWNFMKHMTIDDEIFYTIF